MNKLRRAAFALILTALFALPAAAAPTGQMVFSYNSYTNITTSATTVVKARPGLFAGFCVNTVGTTSTLTAYDNTAASGTKIGTWTTVAVGCYRLDAAFAVGLTIVTGGTAGDITILWR